MRRWIGCEGSVSRVDAFIDGVCHTHVWAEGAECRFLKQCQSQLVCSRLGSHHILLSAMLFRLVVAKGYAGAWVLSAVSWGPKSATAVLGAY